MDEFVTQGGEFIKIFFFATWISVHFSNVKPKNKALLLFFGNKKGKIVS